ncbi:tRNA (adenosine(37)-N6)-threonylcarbamoyltransferase complex transferase subunit TsaD [bacterium]|nr:tRNA (adenosine(37)-N6)-threonylcarbamoyltransferase complex transferase subunit TsaD [bacterium]
MRILGIETSCDETSAAVVEDGKKILSNIILSQADIHKEYGGVVPEIASRHHIENIMFVIDASLKEANLKLKDIDAVAVTQGPGLMGALMVGLSAAKAISMAKGIKIIAVNHIEAHLYANILDNKLIKYPFIGLVVSGAHSSLIYVEELGKYEILGHTIDDAAGESFDKVAKILGLPYPGGPVIDKLSKEGDKDYVVFPRPCMHDGTLNFSFSGLKTAVLYHVNKLKNKGELTHKEVRDISASFQEAVCDVLVKKSLEAANIKNVNNIVVGGGVSLNSRLREKFLLEAVEQDKFVYFPSPKLCMDNAAMIAGLAFEKNNHGFYSELDIDANPSLQIQSWMEKGSI